MGAKNSIWRGLPDGFTDDIGVQAVFNKLEITDCTICLKIRLNIAYAFRTESMSKVTRALTNYCIGIRDMTRLKESSAGLRSEETEMIFDGQFLRLGMQVIYRSRKMTTCCESQSLVLDFL